MELARCPEPSGHRLGDARSQATECAGRDAATRRGHAPRDLDGRCVDGCLGRWSSRPRRGLDGHRRQLRSSTGRDRARPISVGHENRRVDPSAHLHYRMAGCYPCAMSDAREWWVRSLRSGNKDQSIEGLLRTLDDDALAKVPTPTTEEIRASLTRARDLYRLLTGLPLRCPLATTRAPGAPTAPSCSAS